MRFRPSIGLSLLLLALALLFLRLGLWQLDRKAEKEALFERFANAPSLEIGQALDRSVEFARVSARGRYDAARSVLLDNRIWNGRAGVHVLTPFTLRDGRVLLVNRGWLPMAPDRATLPAVSTDDAPRTLDGRLVRPSTGGVRLGEPDVLEPGRWPQLVTYLEIDALARALGTPVEPWILQLDAADPSGFEDRDWQPAVMGPESHGAYAVQWFGLCAAAVVIWLVLGVRRGRRAEERDE